MTGAASIRADLELAGYRLESLIGQGGMGTVYRAEQLRLGRAVALKIMSPDLAGDPLFRERFLRESRIAASLEHPHVVPIFDAGEVEKVLYLAMRFIPGTDLRGLIRREQRLTLEDALEVARQVADGLDSAHALGLVHRDVKPSNVLIADTSGAPGAALQSYLTDFGLSKRVVESTGGTMGRPLGSVHYMSPEHIRGEAVDARSDVYSLGCLLYECITGEVPFVRDSEVSVLYAHLEAPCPSASARRSEAPAAVDEVIAWALAKTPAERPASAGELAAGLERALAGSFSRASSTPARADAGFPRAGSPRPHALVGRLEQELALRAALEETLAGRGGLVLLVGESGIGKTALAHVLADEADRRGVPSVWSAGGAFGEVTPPYWHWIQVLQGLAHRADAAELFTSLGPSAAWLAAIAPELAELGGVPPPASAEGGSEGRFNIYDALARLLELAARGTGLLVVLDDLHLADEASALALGFVAELVRASGVLIVGTYREGELARAEGEGSGAGPSALAELRRFGQTIALAGLREEDVRDLISRRAPAEVGAGLSRRLHEVTGGNPLFVAELLTLLESEHRLDEASLQSSTLPLPTGIRDAIARRVAPLSAAGREALEVASVIGTTFRAGIVASASGRPPGEVLEVLDQAAQLGVVRAAGEFGDTYAFSHGLMQATLYDALPRGRRCSLHAAVGEALEQSFDVDAGEGLATIAFHYLEAAPAGDSERAVVFARRAAERAIATFAYDEAASLYLCALEIVDAKRGGERLSLLLALGHAQMRAGDTEAARETLQRAADAARARGDAQALARASLASGIWGLSLGIDEQLVRLAEDAADQLRGGNARGLLASVTGQLAAALYWSDEVERRERLAEEALALARAEHEAVNTADSARMLAYVIGRYLLTRWGPESMRDYPLSDEMIELSRVARDTELEILVRNWRVCVMCEVGSFSVVDLEIARIEQMANELRQPRAMLFLPLHQATRAGTVGRFDEVERLNAVGIELGRRVRGTAGEVASMAQILSLRLQQGRLAELEDAVRMLARANPGMIAFQCVLALTLAQSGRVSEARAELDRLTRAGGSAVPRDNLHVVAMALLGETAGELSDGRAAHEILTWMRPYAGRWVVSPNAAALWPVGRSLARLAILDGEFDEARTNIAAAREQAGAAGALPSLALLALDEARLFAAEGRPEDSARVRALAGEARERAQQLDMGLVVDAATLLEAGEPG